MCGIYAHLNQTTARSVPRAQMEHRGKDAFGIVHFGDSITLAHARLHVVGVPGTQPLKNAAATTAVTVNGEIYNHASLRDTYGDLSRACQSDCDVLIPLLGEDLDMGKLREIDGVFALVIATADGQWMAARDLVGVNPLYYATTSAGDLFFASERKMLNAPGLVVREFPPGHCWRHTDAGPVPWCVPAYIDAPPVDTDLEPLKGLLEEAVRKRCMADVEFGVLLSGGLDSTIVATVAQKMRKKNGLKPLQSFSIGLEGSPDLLYAAEVAAAIGTEHHTVHFTVEEGLAALPSVVRAIESVDVTTTRASTPMYLLAKYIHENTDVKMVLSGEGADEVFGGYLYFHEAPSAAAFHAETVRKVKSLHRFDLKRGNKSLMAFGIECRVPFVDLDFLAYSMQLDPRLKRPTANRIEKYILRDAFRSEVIPSVLWRQKEQFSDGVGHQWIDSMKAKAAEPGLYTVAAEDFEAPPASAEQAMIMSFFTQHFTREQNVPCGMWAVEWQDDVDPSGRVAKVHAAKMH